jgi:hypothetical protein
VLCGASRPFAPAGAALRDVTGDGRSDHIWIARSRCGWSLLVRSHAGRLFRVRLFVGSGDGDGGSRAWPVAGVGEIPRIGEMPSLDGRAGAEILVAEHASCCGDSYRIYSFVRGVLRTMGIERSAGNFLQTFSTAGVGGSFDCLRPGVLAIYGYSVDARRPRYRVTRTLFVSRGAEWRRWKSAKYTVSASAPNAPLGAADAQRPRFSRCR